MITYALHGNLGTVDDWRAAEFFHGEVDALDLWAEADRGLRLEAWAESFCARVRDAADYRDDEKPWLAGYSLGGRLALHALAAAPTMWGGAVILSAHPGLADEGARELRRQRDTAWADKVRTASWQDFLAAWNAQTVLAGDPGAEFFHRQQQLQSRRESVARAFELWSLGCQADLSECLAACPLPVLWINGGEDAKFTELGAAMSKRLPNGEHRVLDGCGHRILHEAPFLAAEAIRDFQKRNL